MDLRTISIHDHLGRGWARRFGLAPEHPPAALDLGAVTSVDACGVEELVHLACRAARKGAALRLENIPTTVTDDLLRLGLGDLLSVRRRARRGARLPLPLATRSLT